MNVSPSRLYRAPLHQPRNSRDGHTSVVAVNGLGGHAFESWRNQNTGKMWLKDFLPDDIKGVRVMSYGYDSRQCDDRMDIDFLDHRRNLLQTLANARRSTPVCILDSTPICPSIFAQWAKLTLSKPTGTTIDIYWTWDGWHPDTSGKPIQCIFTVIVSEIFNAGVPLTMNLCLYLCPSVYLEI
jgi:hypothetical protein